MRFTFRIYGLILTKLDFVGTSPYTKFFFVIERGLETQQPNWTFGTDGLCQFLFSCVLRVEVYSGILAGRVFGPITLSRQRWSPQ